MPFSKDDKNFIEKILNHDEKALFEFYNLYQKPLYNFIHRQIIDSQICEDILQDVFLDFIEALRDFHYQCSLKTYLFSIAKNKIIDFIRKKKVKKILFSALPSHIVENIAPVLMDDEIERKELMTKIAGVLEELPHDYQVVLRLKYVEGEKVKAISEKLELPFKATESLIFRARKAFVKLFNATV